MGLRGQRHVIPSGRTAKRSSGHMARTQAQSLGECRLLSRAPARGDLDRRRIRRMHLCGQRTGRRPIPAMHPGPMSSCGQASQRAVRRPRDSDSPGPSRNRLRFLWRDPLRRGVPRILAHRGRVGRRPRSRRCTQHQSGSPANPRCPRTGRFTPGETGSRRDAGHTQAAIGRESTSPSRGNASEPQRLAPWGRGRAGARSPAHRAHLRLSTMIATDHAALSGTYIGGPRVQAPVAASASG